MSTGIGFGKIRTQESYFNGRLKSTKVEYEIPETITDKSEVLAHLMKGLELISDKQTHTLTIKIEADPRTHQLRLLTKSYIIEQK